ncbi:MAG TPA: hypothetical protein VJ867_07360 [Gemmatimonadaceae bacterium]|nr:hypothetical protein [Gemmatimonadaceae bacterium]
MSVRRVGALIVLCTMTAQACTVWVPQSGSAADAISARPVSRARVRQTDGTTITLNDPVIASDSVRGVVRHSVRKRNPGDPAYAATPVAIALSDVTRVELPHISKKRTAFLVAGLLATTYLAVALYAVSQLDPLGENGCGFYTCQP